MPLPSVPPQPSSENIGRLRAGRVGYLGPRGTFTEQALWSVPEFATVEAVAAVTIGEAIDSVRAGAIDAAVVPWENSIEGAVGATMDELMAQPAVQVMRQVLLPVVFGLYAQPGVSRDELRQVASHPHAYAQCRGWLGRQLPTARFVSAASTADAAAGVRAGEYQAAICAPMAAREYGLRELAGDIADNPGAVTRFAVVCLPGPPLAATGDDVTSLVVSLAHDEAGSLLRALRELADRGINLTRIESRPTKQALGRYWFYLDCAAHISEPHMAAAVEGLTKASAELRFLGSYPNARPLAE